MLPLYDFKHPRLSHDERTRTSDKIHRPKVDGHRIQTRPKERGGACRDRTDGLKLAKLPLSQLRRGQSQAPEGRRAPDTNPAQGKWWSLSGSNRRPEACKATALRAELRPLGEAKDFTLGLRRRRGRPSAWLPAETSAAPIRP